MKTMRIRNLLTLAVCCLAAVLLSGAALAADVDIVDSGTCGAEGDGSNLKWTLDSEGTLTISGSGKMADWSETRYLPWYSPRVRIKTVNIGSGVTNIGSTAFDGCTRLTSVTIPDGVTKIGNASFVGCRNLTSILIPDTVTIIGDYAFRNCGFETVTIPNRVTSIGRCAFDGSSLRSITIPESVTYIGEMAFTGCSFLEDVYITDMDAWCRITFDGSFATPMGCAKNIYLNGSKIKSVNVPSGVSSLNDTFYNFSDLIEVTLPDSVTSIGADTFGNCISLTDINIPSGVTNIGAYAFSSCSSLSRVSITDIAAWCGISFGDGYSTFVGVYANPLYQGADLYLDGEKLTSLEIPEGVSSISPYAFCGAVSIERVTLPHSLSSIGENAFYCCNNLKSVSYTGNEDEWNAITIDSGNVCLTDAEIRFAPAIVASGTCGAEGDGSNLKWTLDSEGTLTISGSGKMADYNSFDVPWYSSRSSIKTVNIRDGVTSIGNCAFQDCSSLTSVTIPEGVTRIGKQAFAECWKLERINIPSSVTSIGEYAFDSTDRHTELYVDITDIDAWCRISFEGVYANPAHRAERILLNGSPITSVTIPEDVTVLEYTFCGFDDLESVTLHDKLTRIGTSAFDVCIGLESIDIPSSVTSIGERAFASCSNLPSVAIPNGVTSISRRAFSGCIKLTSVTIPNSVTSIGEFAFSGCSNIETVYYGGSQSKWQSIAIGSGNNALTGADIHYNCAYGGTEEYRLEGITVTAAGESVQELCAGELLVSIAVRHMQGDSGAVVMLAQYDAEGRYQGLLWLTLDEMPLDMALKVTLPVDNSDGKIANLKALVVSSILSPIPMGSAVSFGSV